MDVVLRYETFSYERRVPEQNLLYRVWPMAESPGRDARVRSSNAFETNPMSLTTVTVADRSAEEHLRARIAEGYPDAEGDLLVQVRAAVGLVCKGDGAKPAEAALVRALDDSSSAVRFAGLASSTIQDYAPPSLCHR